MAYIKDRIELFTDSADNTFEVELPEHVAEDLLLCCLTQDVGGTISAPTGWTIIEGQSSSGGSRQVWAYKIATSNNENPPVFTSTATEEWCGISVVVADADTTNPIHQFAKNNWVSTNVVTLPSVTTTVDDCLLLYSIGTDNTTSQPRLIPSQDVFFVGKAAAPSFVQSYVSFGFKKTAGVTPEITANCLNGNEGGNAWTLAIKNKTGGQPPILYKNIATLIRDYGYEAGNWSAPNAFAWCTAIGGVGLSAVNSGPATTSSTLISTEVAPNLIVGAWDTIATSINLQNKPVCYSLNTGSWQTSRVGLLGAIIVFADSAGNWKAYNVLKDYEGLSVGVVYTNIISLDSNNKVIDSYGIIDSTDIKYVGYFWHRTLNGTTTTNIRPLDVMILPPAELTGGSAINPVKPSSLFSALQKFSWSEANVISRQGLEQISPRGSIIVGDGVNRTHADFSSTSLELPAPFGKQKIINVGDNLINFEINASADDTILLSNSILSSSRPAIFTINPTSSLLATYDFSGLIIAGFKVNWRSGLLCNKTSFSNCYEIAGEASEFRGCSFDKSLAASALQIKDGASVVNCFFTKGSDDHAIEIDAAGSFTLAGNTFSGYTYDINVTATTGTVTIYVSGETPTYQTAGATVNIVSGATLTLTNLVSGSDIVILAAGTSTHLADVNENSTTTYAFVYSSNDLVDICVYKIGYVPFAIRNYQLSGENGSIPISQRADRNYINPS